MSNKSKQFIGPGCRVNLPHILNNNDLIWKHMVDCPKCDELVQKCDGCNTYFSSYTNYKKHVDRTNKELCRTIYNAKNQQQSYCTTVVEIKEPTITSNNEQNSSQANKSTKPLLTDLETIHKQSLHSVTKCLPIKAIKQNTDEMFEQILFNTYDEEDTDIFDTNDCNIAESDYDSVQSEEEFLEIDSQSNINYGSSDINMENSMSTNDASSLHLSGDSVHQTNNIETNTATNTFEYHHSDHFLNIKKTQFEEVSNVSNDVEYMSSLNLIKILLDNKIGLSHYDVFMKWKNNDRKTRGQYMSLDKVMQIAAEKTYGDSLAKGLSLKVKEVDLPSQKTCSMITFDVAYQIFDLLNDKDLTQPENMIFDEVDGNPFNIAISNTFEDIDSSLLYIRTSSEENIDTKKHILCPIGLYLDELKLDAFGKLGLEPIVLTLLIYNRETRNHHKAHRVIGYMPNFSMLFGHKSYTADDKANDYHHCLSIITEDIRKLQSRDGYKWEFIFKNHPNVVFKRTLKFPLFYVIGDAKGNDMLAGRYGSRNNTKCIARDCNVLLEDCDNPNKTCIFHKQEDMDRKSEEELSNLSFRKLNNNAFKNIWFGSQPYGLFAALPPEPLHVFNLGIVERLACSYMQRLSTEMIKTLDRHVGYICTYYCNQSDREYPNMQTFSSGISEAKRLTAKEKLARIFCIYVTMLTSDFHQEIVGGKGRHLSDNNLNGSIDQREYNNWIKVFEETLLLASWIYCDSHPKALFNGGRKSVVNRRIQQFMKMYSKNAPRKEGKKLKLLKFHHLLHLWWVIRLFGCLLNVDGARGESNNQYLAKYMGNATQKQHTTLNFQTAKNTFKRDIFLKAFKKAFPQSTQQVIREDLENKSLQGSKFIVDFDYDRKIVTTKWYSWKMKSKSCNFSPLIRTAVFEKLKYYNGGKRGRKIRSIVGHTEMNLLDSAGNRDIIRACPTYRSSKHWHDWININWETDTEPNILTSQILMMLDAKTITYVRSNNENSATEHNKIPYAKIAFVHSSDGNRQSKTMPIVGGGGYTSSLASWATMETHYQMVDIDTFYSKCFVIVDLLDKENNYQNIGLAKRVITLIPKKQWSNKFIDYSSNANQSSSIVDDSITDYDLRFFEG